MKPGQDVKGKQAHISQPSGLAVNTQCVCVCVCVCVCDTSASRVV